MKKLGPTSESVPGNRLASIEINGSKPANTTIEENGKSKSEEKTQEFNPDSKQVIERNEDQKDKKQETDKVEEKEEEQEEEVEEEEEMDEVEEKEEAEDEDQENEEKRDRSKRERKRVERLSESLNKRYEAEQSKQEKTSEAISSQLQGSGTPLGQIPLIEASITKSKPIDLKLLHTVVYGRSGSAHEIRSNLRRFRGFSFTKKSQEYIKREQNLSRKTMNEIRNTLRILHMQVTGSMEEIVTRLLEFLLSPSSDVVKYKGKLVKKSRKSSSTSNAKTGSKKTKKTGDKKRISKGAATAPSRKRKASETDEEAEEASDLSSVHSDIEDAPAKRKRSEKTVSEKKKTPSKKCKVSAEAHSEEEKNSARKQSAKAVATLNTKSPASKKIASPEPPPAKRVSRIVTSDEDSDDEVPLSNMVPEKQTFPTDEELKNKVMGVLKTANLQETSMKAVRTAICEQYASIDLSSKKNFINDTIKAYLSSSI